MGEHQHRRRGISFSPHGGGGFGFWGGRERVTQVTTGNVPVGDKLAKRYKFLQKKRESFLLNSTSYALSKEDEELPFLFTNAAGGSNFFFFEMSKTQNFLELGGVAWELLKKCL